MTSATDEIGKKLSRMFARSGATLILHVPNPEHLANTLKEIKAETGNRFIQIVVADFTSLSQVKSLANDVKQKVEHLDVLVNNAGLYPQGKTITVD